MHLPVPGIDPRPPSCVATVPLCRIPTSRIKTVFTAVYLAQVCAAADVGSLLVKVGLALPRDPLLESK